MYYDDKIKEYAKLNYKINSLYCKKYKLDLILSNKKHIKKDILFGKDYH